MFTTDRIREENHIYPGPSRKQMTNQLIRDNLMNELLRYAQVKKHL